MKKSNFVALILSTIGILLLGLGMCMCMIEEWGLFQPGIIVGSGGLLTLLIMIFVYRKMEHKNPIKISLKTVMIVILALVGMLALGIGMSLSMVFGNLILGIVIGILGILILLSLIPICKGLV